MVGGHHRGKLAEVGMVVAQHDPGAVADQSVGPVGSGRPVRALEAVGLSRPPECRGSGRELLVVHPGRLRQPGWLDVGRAVLPRRRTRCAARSPDGPRRRRSRAASRADRRRPPAGRARSAPATRPPRRRVTARSVREVVRRAESERGLRPRRCRVGEGFEDPVVRPLIGVVRRPRKCGHRAWRRAPGMPVPTSSARVQQTDRASGRSPTTSEPARRKSAPSRAAPIYPAGSLIMGEDADPVRAKLVVLPARYVLLGCRGAPPRITAAAGSWLL